MKLKFILNIAILLAFVIAGFSCASNSKTARGNEIVGKIESFKKEKGRLPESLSEIGIEEKEDSPIHYEKKSDAKFILWYGTSLGESATYDSDTKQWK
jgi:hypothetical protein